MRHAKTHQQQQQTTILLNIYLYYEQRQNTVTNLGTANAKHYAKSIWNDLRLTKRA